MTNDPESGVEAQPSWRAGRRGYPGFFSSARTFSLPVGSHVRTGALGGYYIDFSAKPSAPRWPPDWFDALHLHVVAAQWGLGCYERYLSGGEEAWLAAA